MERQSQGLAGQAGNISVSRILRFHDVLSLSTSHKADSRRSLVIKAFQTQSKRELRVSSKTLFMFNQIKNYLLEMII